MNFSLQASQKLLLNDTCDWIKECILSNWQTPRLFHCLHFMGSLEVMVQDEDRAYVQEDN